MTSKKQQKRDMLITLLAYLDTKRTASPRATAKNKPLANTIGYKKAKKV